MNKPAAESVDGSIGAGNMHLATGDRPIKRSGHTNKPQDRLGNEKDRMAVG